MALPKIDLPSFTHQFYNSKKKVKYRPFTMKEQKIMLLAKQSEDKQQILNSVAQIVDLCTFGTVNAMELPAFDLEDIFLRIRSKSVNNITTLKYKIKEKDTGKLTGKHVTVNVNLDEVKVSALEGHTNIIKITDRIGIKMKYPTMALLEDESNRDDHNLIVSCMESVYNGDEVTYIKDCTQEEIEEFIDSLDTNVMLQIREFFRTMPRLRHEIEVKLPLEEGQTEQEVVKIVLVGLESFFQ